MKCDELKPYLVGYERQYYVYDATSVEEAIAELKQKLEDVQASHYAEMVDAGMREYCNFKNPKPSFETLKSSGTCLKSGMTGLPILEIVKYAHELDININYCPMCGRKLTEEK